MGANCDKNIIMNSIVNGTTDREACPKRWIAALVQMCTEKKVGERLNKLNIENYIPTQTEIRQWSDRKKKIERVVIPMIIFIRTDKETEKKLNTYTFIYKLISYPGEKEPATIPDEQIEKLKYMLDNADSTVEISDTIYEVGEEIEIIRGPLKGLSGELCYIEKDKPTIGIKLEILGYAHIRINKNDIKSKNK